MNGARVDLSWLAGLWRQTPNLLTLIRCLLVAPFVFALLHSHYALAFWLFFVAGCTDGLDGFLARRYRLKSRIGAIADPIADKLLLVTGFGMLAWLGQIPWPLFMLVALRDIVIVMGALTYHRRLGPFDLNPSLISKTNTVLQIMLVAGYLVSLGLYVLSPAILSTLMWLTVLTTIVSGASYVWIWGRRYQLQKGKSLT